MRHAIPVAALALLFTLPVALSAQENRVADEQAIRAAITAIDQTGKTPYTSDRVFWSGAYKTPSFGAAQGPRIDEPDVQNRVPGSQQSKTAVRRIDVAQAGDMAWEFSDTELSFRIKDARGERPDTFTTSTLRVWKKVNGQWRVAAFFNFAHDAAARGRARVAEEQRQ